MQGSPLDAGVFLLLIISGFLVLLRRRVAWGEIILANRWLFAFFLYWLLSAMWTDFAFVLFKRWIKDFGNIIMVLVILSEKDYVAAIRAVFARYIYFAVPLSVLFIKYIPEWGRYYNHWTWEPVYIGVTDDKNALGALVFISGLYLMWDLVEIRTKIPVGISEVSKLPVSSWVAISEHTRNPPRTVTSNQWRFHSPAVISAGDSAIIDSSTSRIDWADLASRALLVLMVIWLIGKADSSNALVCLFLGIGTIFVMRRSFNKGLVLVRYLGTYTLILTFLILILYSFPEILGALLEMLGEDMTLTGRTDLWSDLLKEPINPFLGAGYQSFWIGSSGERMWTKFAFHPNQAHNGYLETYLNGGLIGLCLLIAVIFSAGRNLKKELLSRSWVSTILFSFFVTAVFYNWSEALFNKLSPVWFTLLMATVKFPFTSDATKNIPETRMDNSINIRYKRRSILPDNQGAAFSRKLKKNHTTGSKQ